MRESKDERDSGSENQMMKETADQGIRGREGRGIEEGEREEA